MRALRMFGPGDVRVVDMPVPEIGDDELLVQVKSAGICGTDLRIIRNGYAGIGPETPRTLGHEISGIVAAAGKDVRGFRKGMRVGIAPNMGCGNCSNCITGNQHLCGSYEALGVQMDGGFSEYVRIPAKAIQFGNVVELPDHVSYDEAAINEPLSCVYNGILQCPITPGDDVLIIGAGPIGMMYGQLAKMFGAARVFIANRSPERLRMCENIDASFITVPASGLLESMDVWTGGKGVNVCVTANPSPEAQQLAVEVVGVHGRINFFGGLPRELENVSLNTNAIHYKQIVVTGSTKANNHHFRKMLQFISSGMIDVKKLISARYPIERAAEAISFAEGSQGIKTVLTFD